MPHPRLFAAALALTVLALTASAAAQDYPSRPVRIVVGFGPGASGDIAGRVLAQKLSQILGQQFIVENRSGAGSNIGTNYVAKAPKDGYTLLQGTVANTINAALTPNLPYDLTKDFVPVALFATVPNLVVVHPSVGARNIAELIALARGMPDGLAFGSAGVGSGSHFSGELFNVMAGIKLVHVPYPRHGTGRHRPARRPRAGGILTGLFRPAIRRGGPDHRARLDRIEARQDRPRPAHRRRIRPARLRHLRLVRPAGAGRRAARDHRAPR
jgi:tripartite-type tricarboxylate transporter receptor subunit TctC